jgi:hypothetical protein
MLDGPASRDQIDDGNNQCDHEQEMDQTAGHVESPAQKPKDNEDCKNRPKHRYPFKTGNSVRQPPKVRSGISGWSCLWIYVFWKAGLTRTTQRRLIPLG